MIEPSTVFSSLAYGAGLLGGLQMPELIVILVIALIIFGPKNLPKIGQALGASLREFREASKKVTDEIQNPNDPAALQKASEASAARTAQVQPAPLGAIGSQTPAHSVAGVHGSSVPPSGPTSPGGGAPLAG